MDGHGCRWILLFPRQDPPPKRKIRIPTFPSSRASLVSLWLCISKVCWIICSLFFFPPSSLLIFFRDFHVFLSSLFSSLVNHSSIDSALDENITENIYNFATNEIVREKYIIFKLIFCKLFQYRISSNWKVSIIKSRVKPRIIFNFVEIRFLSAFDLSWFIK